MQTSTRGASCALIQNQFSVSSRPFHSPPLQRRFTRHTTQAPLVAAALKTQAFCIILLTVPAAPRDLVQVAALDSCAPPPPPPPPPPPSTSASAAAAAALPSPLHWLGHRLLPRSTVCFPLILHFHSFPILHFHQKRPPPHSLNQSVAVTSLPLGVRSLICPTKS